MTVKTWLFNGVACSLFNWLLVLQIENEVVLLRSCQLLCHYPVGECFSTYHSWAPLVVYELMFISLDYFLLCPA